MVDDDAKKHFAFVAFPAFGHIIPLITFAEKVSSKYLVTLVVSKVFVPELQSLGLLKSRNEDSLRVLPLEDGVLPEREIGLAPQVAFQRVARIVEQMTEALTDVLPKLFSVSTSLEKIDNGPSIHPQPVNAVVVERFLSGRVIPITEEFKLPCFVFCSDGIVVTNPAAYMAENPASAMMTIFADLRARNMKWIPRAKGQIYNIFREADPASVSSFEMNPRAFGVPLLCVGPLFPQEFNRPATENTKTLKWLDNHPNHSVIYMTFGTVINLSPAQMESIFHGLLSTKKPFIWSLKKQDHDALPKDIKQDINTMSMSPNPSFSVVSWVPQRLVLAHQAVSVFITHGGWNSISEAVYCGVPMVVWPMMTDGHANGDWISKRGLGEKLPNTQMGPTGRIVPAEEIKEYATKVGGFVGSDDSYRKQSEKMSDLAKKALQEGGSSWKDFETVMSV